MRGPRVARIAQAAERDRVTAMADTLRLRAIAAAGNRAHNPAAADSADGIRR